MKSVKKALAAVAALWLSAAACAAELRSIEDFGPNPARLTMQVYLPDTLEQGAALVVLPHGCFQGVQQVFDHTGWVQLADRHGFALLFPGTNKDNESFGGCFRTWQAEHQARGAGEPLTIIAMIDWLLEHQGLDRARVYMAGMSSGGLVTSVMLATYPERFAAGAVQSAYPYRCANAFEELQTCSLAQKELSPEAWSALVLDADPGYSGARPRVALWHGAADQLLLPANLDLQLQQWAGVMGVDSTQFETNTIDGQQRRRYRDASGEVVIETVLVAGMDHAIAIDPDGTPPCGAAAPFIVDANVCAAQWIGRWFGIVR